MKKIIIILFLGPFSTLLLGQDFTLNGQLWFKGVVVNSIDTLSLDTDSVALTFINENTTQTLDSLWMSFKQSSFSTFFSRDTSNQDRFFLKLSKDQLLQTDTLQIFGLLMAEGDGRSFTDTLEYAIRFNDCDRFGLSLLGAQSDTICDNDEISIEAKEDGIWISNATIEFEVNPTIALLKDPVVINEITSLSFVGNLNTDSSVLYKVVPFIQPEGCAKILGDTAEISVNPLPSKSLTLDYISDSPICEGEDFLAVLIGDHSSDQDYFFDLNFQYSQVDNQDSVDTFSKENVQLGDIIKFNELSVGVSGSLKLTTISNTETGCTNDFGVTKSVTVKTKPMVQLLSQPDTLLCLGQKLNIQVDSIPGLEAENYQWEFSNQENITGRTLLYKPTTSGRVLLEILETESSCGAIDSFFIEVIDTTIELSSLRDAYCEDEQVEIQLDGSRDNINAVWSNGQKIDLSNSSIRIAGNSIVGESFSIDSLQMDNKVCPSFSALEINLKQRVESLPTFLSFPEVVCAGETFDLRADVDRLGSVGLLWSNAEDTEKGPIWTQEGGIDQTKKFQFLITDQSMDFCTDSIEVIVNVLSTNNIRIDSLFTSTGAFCDDVEFQLAYSGIELNRDLTLHYSYSLLGNNELIGEIGTEGRESGIFTIGTLDSGQYWLSLDSIRFDSTLCAIENSRDSFKVKKALQTLALSGPVDLTICRDEDLVITAQPENAIYEWQYDNQILQENSNHLIRLSEEDIKGEYNLAIVNDPNYCAIETSFRVDVLGDLEGNLEVVSLRDGYILAVPDSGLCYQWYDIIGTDTLEIDDRVSDLQTLYLGASQRQNDAYFVRVYLPNGRGDCDPQVLGNSRDKTCIGEGEIKLFGLSRAVELEVFMPPQRSVGYLDLGVTGIITPQIGSFQLFTSQGVEVKRGVIDLVPDLKTRISIPARLNTGIYYILVRLSESKKNLSTPIMINQ